MNGKQPKRPLHGAAARSAAGEKCGGRPKGIPNKMTMTLKEMILGALNDAGGKEYLASQATANPGAFMTLVGKVLPIETKSELTGANGGPIAQSFVVKFVNSSEDGKK